MGRSLAPVFHVKHLHHPMTRLSIGKRAGDSVRGGDSLECSLVGLSTLGRVESAKPYDRDTFPGDLRLLQNGVRPRNYAMTIIRRAVECFGTGGFHPPLNTSGSTGLNRSGRGFPCCFT